MYALACPGTNSRGDSGVCCVLCGLYPGQSAPSFGDSCAVFQVDSCAVFQVDSCAVFQVDSCAVFFKLTALPFFQVDSCAVFSS